MVLGCGCKGLSRGVELRSKIKSIKVLALQTTQAQNKGQNYFGERIEWNKRQKWILLVGKECLGCPKVEGGFLGTFYHRRHGKIKKGTKPKTSPKPKWFFLKQKPQKFWSVTAPTPLGKISSPRFQLVHKQVWVLCPKEILSLPSSFILGVIAPLNFEKLDGFLSGPPLKLF